MKLWEACKRLGRRLPRPIYGVLVVGAVAFPLWSAFLPKDQKLLSVLLTALAAVGGGLLTNLVERWRHPPSPGALGDARRRYLRGLRKECQLLPLAALGGDEGLDETLTLEQVYIDLDTTATVAPDSKTGGAVDKPSHSDLMPPTQQESVPLSARAALAQPPWLALLGDPGGGKSTFVRQILAEMATHQELGNQPAPDLPADLLPVLINLRDLTSALDQPLIQQTPEADRRRLLARLIRDQAVQDLERLEAGDFAEGLRDAFENGRCFLVLDGLDEMPERVRPWVREAVRAVIGVYRVNKVVITCRARSYVDEAVLPDFQAYRLAPFNADKIRAFVEAWYLAQHRLGKVSRDQATPRAQDLTRAALTTDLRELSANPMLLTTMAMIHQRDIGLPRERVRLYERAVELLLRRWEEYRRGKGRLTADDELAPVLSDDLLLRSMMEILAYEAHRNEPSPGAGGELTRGQALTLIDHPPYLRDAGLAQKFLDYIDERAGLLVGQGGSSRRPGSYRFPHRTFQEYLAACYLVGQDPIERVFLEHAKAGDRWNLVAELGAEELLYNKRLLRQCLNLAYALCPDATHAMPAARAVVWSGKMAALIGRERISYDGRGAAYLQRLMPRLQAAMQGDLPAPERADAGNALGKLGDPRFRGAEAWCLPVDAMLGFVKIEAGGFWMGSDPERDVNAYSDEQPQHRIELSTYYISRYPVTVAQFRAFVEVSGYSWAGKDEPQGEANHPVVYVSWDDAMAYCQWLTEQLRDWSETPEELRASLQGGGSLTLPSEAQWEKAARGDDGRIYPWGDEANADLANYADTGIGGTSPVGCFTGGERPYEVYDMSGNVWEWCLDWFDEGYYQQSLERDPRGPEAGADRVFRGGSWSLVARFARSALRFAYPPGYRDGGLGFRCLSSASSQ